MEEIKYREVRTKSLQFSNTHSMKLHSWTCELCHGQDLRPSDNCLGKFYIKVPSSITSVLKWWWNEWLERGLAELAAANGRPWSGERHSRLPAEEGRVLKHQLIYRVYKFICTWTCTPTEWPPPLWSLSNLGAGKGKNKKLCCYFWREIVIVGPRRELSSYLWVCSFSWRMWRSLYVLIASLKYWYISIIFFDLWSINRQLSHAWAVFM